MTLKYSCSRIDLVYSGVWIFFECCCQVVLTNRHINHLISPLQKVLNGMISMALCQTSTIFFALLSNRLNEKHISNISNDLAFGLLRKSTRNNKKRERERERHRNVEINCKWGCRQCLNIEQQIHNYFWFPAVYLYTYNWSIQSMLNAHHVCVVLLSISEFSSNK